MTSWKTLLAGSIGAVGTYLSGINDPAWVHILGVGIAGLGVLLIGVFARDNKVTSEQAGAK